MKIWASKITLDAAVNWKDGDEVPLTRAYDFMNHLLDLYDKSDKKK